MGGPHTFSDGDAYGGEPISELAGIWLDTGEAVQILVDDAVIAGVALAYVVIVRAHGVSRVVSVDDVAVDYWPPTLPGGAL